VIQIGFVADGVGATEHGEFRFGRALGERRLGKKGSEIVQKELGRFARRHQRHAGRIVQIQIERPADR
jgi:hypothetical protein